VGTTAAYRWQSGQAGHPAVCRGRRRCRLPVAWPGADAAGHFKKQRQRADQAGNAHRIVGTTLTKGFQHPDSEISIAFAVARRTGGNLVKLVIPLFAGVAAAAAFLLPGPT
jgi:hypothetical protein